MRPRHHARPAGPGRSARPAEPPRRTTRCSWCSAGHRATRAPTCSACARRGGPWSRSRPGSTSRAGGRPRPRRSPRCARAPTSSTRRRSSTAPGAATPTSCSSAATGRATWARGPTTSPTPSSPGGSRSRRCCRWRCTPTCWPGCRACRRSCSRWSPATAAGAGVPVLRRRGLHPGRAVPLPRPARRRRAGGPVPQSRTAASAAWRDTCTDRWREEDALSLVAFMRRDHATALADAGIPTVAALAARRPEELPDTIGRRSRERLSAQARLQLAERATGTPSYELLPPGARPRAACGCRRPARATCSSTSRATRSPATAGLEYLRGVLDRRRAVHRLLWARPGRRGGAAPSGTVEQLVDHLTAALRGRPGDARLPLRALRADRAEDGCRPGTRTREAELDRLLRADVLRRPVRRGPAGAADQQGVLLDQAGRGLLLRAHPRARRRRSPTPGRASSPTSAGWPTRDQAAAGPIEAYNRDDCPLHPRAARLAGGPAHRAVGSGALLSRPRPRPDGCGETRRPSREAGGRPEADLPEPAARPPEATGCWPSSCGWHAREARPAWWEYFRLRDLTADDSTTRPLRSGPL